MPLLALPDGRFLEVPEERTPEYVADIKRKLAEVYPDEYGETTLPGYFIEAIPKGIPRGLLGGALTGIGGLAYQANAITDKMGLEDLIDAGEENALISYAREGREALNEGLLGASAPYRDKWIVKAGEALGSFGLFMIPGTAISRFTSLTGWKSVAPLLPLASGIGAGEAGERVERARASGIEVSQEEENSSVLWGSLIGATELASVWSILSRVTKWAPPPFKKLWMERIKEALISGTSEGIQEVSASLMQDAVEKGY